MRKHRLVRLVAVLLYIVAALFFVAGIVAGIAFSRNGFGAGWGPGSSAWVLIPILAAALLGATVFVVLASVLYFLAGIDTNLSLARARRLAARQPAVPVVEAEAPPTVTATAKLPGRDEAARIAAEMAAVRAAEGRQAAEDAAKASPPADTEAGVPPEANSPAGTATPPAENSPA